jgi:hypothetical protein
LLIGALFFPASFVCFIFDKTEAPRGALRQYNADELEPLSRAGLEALLMEIQDDYHLREGEDQITLPRRDQTDSCFAPQTPARKCWTIAARDASD